MKKNWVLSQESFDALLDWLDSDRERAGIKYEEIRRRLITIFTGRGCSDAEDLADEAINRVVSKLREIESEFKGDRARYFYGVANKVLMEYLRRKPPQPPPVSASDSNRIEHEYHCLEKCIERLSAENRHLLSEYYGTEGKEKAEKRKKLAEELGIAPNALEFGPIAFDKLCRSAWRIVSNAQSDEISGIFKSLRLEATESLEKSNLSRNIDDQEMRNYLLGTLEADRRTEFEEKILSDTDVYEELLANEAELVDQYVAGSLSKLEKHQFETHFLITAERQKNLRFGRLLRKYLHSRPALVQEPVSVGQAGNSAPANRSFPLFLASFGRGPVLAVSAALVLCLGLIFCYWVVARRPAASAVQQNNSHLMVVTIAPGSTRSSGTTKRVTVPRIGVDVKLELEITNRNFNNYKSELIRESESLDTQGELKMETRGNQHFVPLTIAGDRLSPGDYQVKLSGVLDSGHDEFIDKYSFRVITE